MSYTLPFFDEYTPYSKFPQQEGQEALGRATSETLDSLSSGHKQLQQQQQQLSSSHMAVHSVISSNLRELSREKKLIASGQRELASITEAIRHKLGEELGLDMKFIFLCT